MHDGNERYRDAITVKPHFPNDNLPFSGAEGRISFLGKASIKNIPLSPWQNSL
jgi:hypothetical protein